MFLGYTSNMRTALNLLLVIVIFSLGCTSEPVPEAESPSPSWTVFELNSVPVPLDVPYEVVIVNEIARFSPPDDIIWPAAFDFRGQTAWMWDDNRPELYAGRLEIEIMQNASGESEEAVKAIILTWDVENNDVQSTTLMTSPPSTSWPPIPYLVESEIAADEDTRVAFAWISPAGESSIRSVSIGDEEPFGLPIIDTISFGSVSHPDVDEFELSAEHVYSPIDRSGAPSLVFESFFDHPVKMPDDTMRFSSNFFEIDMSTQLNVRALNTAVEATFGAAFTGFLDDPQIYFFAGESPFDSRQYAFLTGLETTLAIPSWNYLNEPDDIPVGLRITGYIPSVRYGDSQFVFAEFGEEESDENIIVAINLNSLELDTCEPTVIWTSEVPGVFGVASRVPVGSDARPYIVCLDPFTGELTVFDPLLGSIRYQQIIELAQVESGGALASFCVNFDPDPERPVVFIHDPNANEIIELEIETREAVGAGVIIPVDELD